MKTTFVLDANVMIQAKRRFYPFDICPGYWKTVKWHREQTNLISIDRVWDEIECGGDDLWEWVRNTFGRESFADTDDVTTQARFAEMMAWVQVQPQFSLQAK